MYIILPVAILNIWEINIMLNCDLEKILNWVCSSVENVIYCKKQAQVIFSSKRVKDCHLCLLNMLQWNSSELPSPEALRYSLN